MIPRPLRTITRTVRRAGRRRYRLGTMLTVAAVAMAALAWGEQALERVDLDTPATADTSPCAAGPVTNVVDADTIDVGACRVRLLAVDAPETQSRQRGTPWCADYQLGASATRAVETLVLGQPVTFGASEDDSSGRDMAAEVFLPDGTELGQWLVTNGYAVPWPAATPAEACPPGAGPGMEPSR